MKPCRPTKSDKRLHHEKRRHEGDDEADQDDPDVAAGKDAAILVEIENERSEHGRDRQEERELRRGALLAFHQKRAGDGRAGARHAGDDRQALEDADEKRQPKRKAHGVRVVRLDVEAVERGERHAADDQHDADQRRRIEEHVLDEIVEGEADDRRGQKRDDDGRDEAARVRIARKRNQDAPEPGEIDDDHGEDRAELDEHAEGVPEGLLAMRADAEKLSRQKQMGGRGDRDELRYPLNDPENDGIEYGL